MKANIYRRLENGDTTTIIIEPTLTLPPGELPKNHSISVTRRNKEGTPTGISRFFVNTECAAEDILVLMFGGTFAGPIDSELFKKLRDNKIQELLHG